MCGAVGDHWSKNPSTVLNAIKCMTLGGPYRYARDLGAKDVTERSGLAGPNLLDCLEIFLYQGDLCLQTEPHCTSASPWNNPCVEGRIQSVTATSIEGYVVV